MTWDRGLYLANMAGIAVFAISGALSAGRKQFDLLGVLIIALVTALGGGTLRDLLLDRHPVSWIRDPMQLLVIASVALATVVVTWMLRRPPSERALLIADALGLALFSITGAQIASERQSSAAVILLMGTITGAAGGLFRDVLSGEVPVLLRPTTIYATTAIAGIAAFLTLQALGVRGATAALAGMAVIAALRLTAIRFDLRLPTFTLPPE
jgi:uncharacterized membrane protein YeiH